MVSLRAALVTTSSRHFYASTPLGFLPVAFARNRLALVYPTFQLYVTSRVTNTPTSPRRSQTHWLCSSHAPLASANHSFFHNSRFFRIRALASVRLCAITSYWPTHSLRRQLSCPFLALASPSPNVYRTLRIRTRLGSWSPLDP